MATERQARRKARRFYDRALTAAERADLPLALEMEGVAEEVAVLRLRLRKALMERPSDLPLMLRGIEVLSRTLARRYHLDKQQGRAAAEAIRGVLDEVQVWREAEAVKEAARG